MLQMSTLFYFIFFILKVCFIFLMIVLVRVTNPRLKIEGITKLTWIFILILVFISFLLFNFGFYSY